MASTECEKVWMDVDTGVDDTHALLLAFNSPEIDVIGVSCVAGNGTVDVVLEATCRVLDSLGVQKDLPVARGCSKPLVEAQHSCPEIHGVDCIGDLNPPLPESNREVSPQHAVSLLLETLRASQDQDVTIIALAPLTNIATALRMDHELMKTKVKRIVWMGGAVAKGGNVSAWGEANAYYDPEAAHIMFTSDIPILLYPWDVYTKVSYTAKELQDLGHPHGQSENLSARLLHRDMTYFKIPQAMVGDAGAVAAVIKPDCVVTKPMHVAMELQGKHTRGMTVCDQRGEVFPPDHPKEHSNAVVCVDVNAESMKNLFTERVLTQKSV